jgi:hypothetical protein
MAVFQNLVPLVNIKIAGKWMFIPLKMVLIGIDPYPYYFPLNLSTEFQPGDSMARLCKRPGRQANDQVDWAHVVPPCTAKSWD